MTGKHYLPEHDDILRAVEDRALLPAIAARLGKSERSVRARWFRLRRGKPTRRTDYNRIWSRADDARLQRLAGRLNAEQCAARLGRTPTAIRVRAKRLGLRWYVPNAPRQQRHPGYTMREVAKLLGIRCAKSVGKWIARGWLRAEQRPVRMGQHALWRIEVEALEAFLREYRWLYDPSRIKDPAWARWVARLPPARYVGTSEAARVLCYTTGSVAQLCRKGDLPAEKWGAFWRIPVAAIDAFTPPPVGHGAVVARDELRARRAETLARRRSRRVAPSANGVAA